MRRAVLILALITLFSASTQAQTSDLVHASLVASVSTLKPGEPFTVGVLLKIKSGRHVYWSNPGDAGLPTRVQWTLPPGYSASPLRFPVPLRIEEPGNIVVYGYTDQVLLTSTITPSSLLASTDSTAIPIAAKVTWLCCDENGCIPGKATVNLQLIPGQTSVPDHMQFFEQWQNRLPTIAAATPAPLVLSDPSPQTKIITPRQITDVKSIIPGAADGLILTIGTPQATPTGTTIPLTVRVLKGQTVTATSFPILLTWPDPNGMNRLGEQINVPIQSAH